MAVSFAVGLRACCVALGLLVGTARAAEPVSPLVGQTRDQLLARYGEPRSQMEQGSRVIYFYPRERIVLRDNVVVEVEEIAADAPAPGASQAAPPTGATKDGSAPPPAPAEPKLGIKMVLPKSAKDSRSGGGGSAKTPAQTLPTPPVVTPTIIPPATSTPVEAQPVPAEEPAKPAVAEQAVTGPAPDPALEKKKAAEELKAKKKADDLEAKKKADELEAKKKKEQALKAARRRMEEAAGEPSESVISRQTYLLAFAIVAVGAGLLYWRYRQRQLELAASSVENTPVASTAAPVFTGNGFTADVLHKLDWKYFEELVAAYYSKTGVVAVRTKTGPESPVHIKISWKGEPRPFAYVQCIPHPTALIDSKPLHALIEALAADDIRRGYVVTDGKFNVAARDFAEEKHLTLLPGDIFLEKLNALPAAARTEIMQSIAAADVG